MCEQNVAQMIEEGEPRDDIAVVAGRVDEWLGGSTFATAGKVRMDPQHGTIYTVEVPGIILDSIRKLSDYAKPTTVPQGTECDGACNTQSSGPAERCLEVGLCCDGGGNG